MPVQMDIGKLRVLGDQADAKMERVLEKAATRVEAVAKQNIVSNGQVDTGAMLNAVTASRESSKVWVVYVGVEYGIYQEMGTYKMVARPFLVPALTQVARELGPIAAAEFKF